MKRIEIRIIVSFTASVSSSAKPNQTDAESDFSHHDFISMKSQRLPYKSSNTTTVA